MTSLTEPIEELQRELIAALEGEGFAYNELTTEFQVYLATCLGDANAWKTKSVNEMLAELNTDFGGSTVSHLTASYAELLDTVEETIVGGGAPDVTAPEITSATTASVTESTGAGQVVYTVTATDASPPLVYAIGGTDAADFTINSSTGTVTLTADPVWTTKSSYSFTVTATDAESNVSAAQTVTLTVAIAFPMTGALLDLDFTTDQGYAGGSIVTSTSLLSITRTTAANGQNQDGTWSSFSTGVMVRTNLGLQSEPARTNRVLRSRDLSNASWTKSNVTATLDQTGITGVANTASKILATSSAGTVTQAITDVTSRARTFSVFVSRITGTGTLEASVDNGSTYTVITPADGGALERKTFNQTLGSPTVIFRIATSGDAFFIDGVQLEEVSVGNPTSVIFTVGAAVVRNADVITLTDTTPVSLASGVILLDWEDLAGPVATAHTLYAQRVGSNDFEVFEVTATDKVQPRVRVTSDQTASLAAANSVIANAMYKAAFRYGTNDFAVGYSTGLDTGGSAFADTSGSVPTTAFTVGFGQNGAGASQGMCRIRRLTIMPAASMSNTELVTWSGGTAVGPISFTDGDEFTAPVGIGWPTTVNSISIPQLVTYNGGASEFRVAGTLTDYVHASIAAATPYYVDAAAANDSGNGLTSGTPKQKISSAIGLANADGQTGGRIIVAAGTYYQDKSMNSATGTVEPTKHMGFVASGGRVVHVASTDFSFPGSPDGVFTNSYVGGPTTGVRVFDKAVLDAKSLYTEIPLLASQAAVDAASSGGWIATGGAITIRRADAARPTTTNTLIVEDFDVALMDDCTKHQYYEGIDFVGGRNGAFASRDTSTAKNLVFNDCTFRYSGGASSLWDAFRIQTPSSFILTYNCHADKAIKDGFNVHSGVGTPNYVMHLNPTGWYNGSSLVANCNYLTAHEETVSFTAGGSGGRSVNGPDVHYIDGTKSYFVGVQAEATATGGSDPSAFKITTSGIGYFEKCTATSTNKAFNAVGGTDPTKAAIYKRGCRTVSGVDSTTSGGTIGTF